MNTETKALIEEMLAAMDYAKVHSDINTSIALPEYNRVMRKARAELKKEETIPESRGVKIKSIWRHENDGTKTPVKWNREEKKWEEVK